MVNVAYGVGKQAVDRLSADTAHELKDQGVTVVSLWPGIVRTELIKLSFERRTGDVKAGSYALRVFSLLTQEDRERVSNTQASPLSTWPLTRRRSRRLEGV